MLVAIGLVLFRTAPIHAHYLADLLPTMILFGVGAGVAFPSLMTLRYVGRARRGLGPRLRSGSTPPSRSAARSASRCWQRSPPTGPASAQAHGASIASSLTSGYRLAFTIGAVLVIGAVALAAVLLRAPAVQEDGVVRVPETIELEEAA